MIYEQIVDSSGDDEPMTEELACRIIAHHMGYRDAFNPADGDYTKSVVYKYRDLNNLPEVIKTIGTQWEFEFDNKFDRENPYILDFFFRDAGSEHCSTGYGHRGRDFKETMLFGIAKAIREFHVREAKKGIEDGN